VTVSLYLSGTWVIFGCEILVTFSGCRHLDGLEAAEELWQEWCLFLATSRWFCEGCCAFPGGASKATLVNCSCHWVISLAVGSYGALGEFGFGLPISYRTTRCRSTQRGLVCRQAREPQEKNLVFILCMIGFLPVIDHHILWLVHPLRDGIKIISLHLHFHKLVVTSSLV
jgi:hypothetical protein